jgi:flagellar motor component MotA
MLKFMSKIDQTLNSHSQAIAKMDAHFEQIMNHLNREEEELQRQSMANLDGHYMVDESTSYHEQAITTMKNGEVVETNVEERKEEQIEAPQTLQQRKRRGSEH